MVIDYRRYLAERILHMSRPLEGGSEIFFMGIFNLNLNWFYDTTSLCANRAEWNKRYWYIYYKMPVSSVATNNRSPVLNQSYQLMKI